MLKLCSIINVIYVSLNVTNVKAVLWGTLCQQADACKSHFEEEQDTISEFFQ